MPSRITIIRHAPTEYNKKDVFMGTLDIPVVSFDRKRVQELKELLLRESFTEVYSSPLQRALQTARTIVGNEYKIIVDNRLIERNLGNWQGEKKEEIRKLYSNVFDKEIMDFYYTPENGEYFKTMICRIADFLCNTYTENGNILVFTHNGVFRVIKSLLTGYPLSKVFNIKEPFLIPQTFIFFDTIYLKIKENPFYTIDENYIENYIKRENWHT